MAINMRQGNHIDLFDMEWGMLMISLLIILAVFLSPSISSIVDCFTAKPNNTIKIDHRLLDIPTAPRETSLLCHCYCALDHPCSINNGHVMTIINDLLYQQRTVRYFVIHLGAQKAIITTRWFTAQAPLNHQWANIWMEMFTRPNDWCNKKF